MYEKETPPLRAGCSRPLLLLAYHYGPGQAGLARDEAAEQIALAQNSRSEGRLARRHDRLRGCARQTSRGRSAITRWQLRLAQSKARMHSGELPEPSADLESLLAEMEKGTARSTQLEDVRANLGTAQYYAGWLMRLEGATTEEWTVQVENARQHFRLLAEEKLGVDPRRGKGSSGKSRSHHSARAHGSLASCKACRFRSSARAAKT